VKRPNIINYKLRPVSRSQLEPIKERNDKILKASIKPEGFYSKKRDDIAWIEPKV